jgi:hypothetical protein
MVGFGFQKINVKKKLLRILIGWYVIMEDFTIIRRPIWYCVGKFTNWQLLKMGGCIKCIISSTTGLGRSGTNEIDKQIELWEK